MIETFETYAPPTWKATRSATSSPGSASGATRYGAPAGQMTLPFGPEAALANLSARQAQEQGLLTSGTCGPRSSTSSRSAALQSSLESRLRQRLGSSGSILFKLTWKERVTPSGRRICALRASAWRPGKAASARKPSIGFQGPFSFVPIPSWPQNSVLMPSGLSERLSSALHTSGSACTSWPTPNAGPQNDNDSTWEQRRAECAECHGNNGFGLTLGMAAQLAGWPTPRAAEAGPDFAIQDRPNSGGMSLQTTAQLASWATPATRDYRFANSRSYQERGGGTKGEQLNNQVVHSGPTPTGSTAETASTGQLNPSLSRWLMGLPPEWDLCGIRALKVKRRR